MGRVKHCVYGHCPMKTNIKTNKVTNCPSVFFIKFPSPITQLNKCQTWVKACGRTDFKTSDVKRSTYICSRHFVDFNGPTTNNPDPVSYLHLYPAALVEKEADEPSLIGVTENSSFDMTENSANETEASNLMETAAADLMESAAADLMESASSDLMETAASDLMETAASNLKEAGSESFDLNFNNLKPLPGWSLEILENTAIFSKSKNNYVIMQCIFKKSSGEEVTVCVKVMNELTILSIPGENIRSINGIYEYVKKVNQFTCCPGNSDLDLVHLFKTKPVSSRKITGVYSEILNSVHSMNCERYIFSYQKRCPACTDYRSSLRKLRLRNSVKSDAGTLRYTKVVKKSKKQTILSEKTKKDMSSLTVLLQEKLKGQPPGSLASVFLRQQIKAMKRSKFAMRWDPQFIKWCIYLKNKSTKAYETVRKSDMISVPTTRTLYKHNHTHLYKPGFSTDMFLELAQDCDIVNLPEHQKYFVLSLDEMKIKEDLVCHKNTGLLTGFIDKNHNQLYDMEREVKGVTTPPLASNVLQLMIRGITSSIVRAFAHFPTKGASSSELNSIIWEAIRRLEASGFRILAVVGDGAVSNRKFFHMSQTEGQKIPYKTVNLFAMDEERPVYFISDAPHLIKTVRNGFSNSGTNSNARALWINNEEISWKVILRLYFLQLRLPGEFKHVSKLTYAHVYLHSYSKMKVNLATQVLSETVASGIETLLSNKNCSYKETVKFIRIFNKFFDLCNVKNYTEGIYQRNNDKKPFSSKDDSRLAWLEFDFINYLDDWEKQVMNRPGKFSKSQRDSMLLSKETIEGLKITALSTVNIVKFLLNKGAKFVLTQHLNQDVLEQLFGRHRAAGGRNSNPTVWHFGANKDSFRSLKGLVLDAIGGNTT